jgi:antitoxin-like ribbon-helix-helix protein
VALVNDAPREQPQARRSSREGQTNIAAWFPMNVKFQLDELRLQVSRQRGRKVSLTELQAEAYNDLFKKYGMAEIAPIQTK